VKIIRAKTSAGQDRGHVFAFLAGVSSKLAQILQPDNPSNFARPLHWDRQTDDLGIRKSMAGFPAWSWTYECL